MRDLACPVCGLNLRVYKNPVPTVDVLIAQPGLGIVLVRRRNDPPGWALPGGFVDYGESLEQAARREALEETGLHVELRELLGLWSDPERDPRLHTITAVFVAVTDSPEALCGGDDASEARFFALQALPRPLAFDHGLIIEDFKTRLAGRYGL